MPETTYKILPIKDGTFEVIEMLDGRSVKTKGNYDSEPMARRVLEALEKGQVIKIGEEYEQ